MRRLCVTEPYGRKTLKNGGTERAYNAHKPLYIRLKLAGSSHILTKSMDAQRRTALILSLKAWAVRRVCVTGV